MADTLIQGTTIIEDKRTSKNVVWSVSGAAFTTSNPYTDNITKSETLGFIRADAADIDLLLPVTLPNGVTLQGIIVYGNAAAIAGITWTLFRLNRVGGASTMATAAIGTEDTSITNEIIDNHNFSYMIGCGSNEFDTNDEIYGAKITYKF